MIDLKLAEKEIHIHLTSRNIKVETVNTYPDRLEDLGMKGYSAITLLSNAGERVALYIDTELLKQMVEETTKKKNQRS